MRHTADLEQSSLLSLESSSLSWAQLERGALDVAYRVLDDGPLRISSRRVNLGIQMNAKIEPNRTVVGTIASSEAPARWFGSPFDDECVAVGRDELDLRTSGPVTVSAVAIDVPGLASFSQAPDVAVLAKSLARFGVSRKPIPSGRLRAAIGSACSMPQRAAQTVSGTLIPLLAAALDELDGHAVERAPSLNARFAAVRACEAYMREHLDSTVTLLDLSRVSRVRSRSLINAFEAITGYSPMDYLKRLRLSGAHRALRRADPHETRIIDVAADWGFWHMGHFTAAYRAMFGETPSQTLRTRITSPVVALFG